MFVILTLNKDFIKVVVKTLRLERGGLIAPERGITLLEIYHQKIRFKTFPNFCKITYF